MDTDPQQIPQYMAEVYSDGRENLTESEGEMFREILPENRDTFYYPAGEPGKTTIGMHSIKLKEEIPKLEDMKLIEKSNHPWSSGLVLVQKKDLSWRLCVDYRKLNEKTIKDAYPIPRIENNIDALSGAKWMSVLDLSMAYRQVPMNPADKEKTAFSTPRGGLYQYVTMPFGLSCHGKAFKLSCTCISRNRRRRVYIRYRCGSLWNWSSLSQVQEQERVIRYAGRTLNKPERNYCVTRKELLEVVYFIKYFRHYLLGHRFKLRTDRGSLTWLYKFKDPDGQKMRWIQQLSSYDFKIVHIPGSKHENADALSRIVVDNKEFCKQCNLPLDYVYNNSTDISDRTNRCDTSDSLHIMDQQCKNQHSQIISAIDENEKEDLNSEDFPKRRGPKRNAPSKIKGLKNSY
ncbi:unnamed protein product [Mytilus coruscus]|uniref:Reverse transcriptase RNase H-like domain-containing protein n=1 Tax=Mytilus coruscus TaxID=42192 RepID=A0A6J8A8E6_MYTCO|nr:unnamed protein product [Mytilus coruscus]